jgi:pyruvate formate lyase activating enzyme
MTPSSLERILSFSDSITFDIKAVTPGIHRLLTGAPVEPVIRNSTYIIEHALEKIFAFRVVVYPTLVEEAQNVASFLADLSVDAPLCFLAFRPNFVLDRIRGITRQELEGAVSFARSAGLKNVTWSGLPNISGAEPDDDEFERLAQLSGCQCPHERRLCTCEQCPLIEYTPSRRT